MNKYLKTFSCFLMIILSASALAQEPKPVPADRRTMQLPWAPRDIRTEDPRVGVMSDRKTGVIRHWHLQKGDHIVFYVDTLISQPWRDAIKEGLCRWNIAFREIGLGDVIVANDYPRDAAFSADDSTHNVVRYIANDKKENAQGVFWFDERSGEIGRGEIFWWSGVVQKLRTWLFCQTASAWKDVRNNISEAALREAVSYVAAHEMGHVLGLKHNMRGSFAIPTDSLRSASFTRRYGTTASIMDYARFNFVAQPGDVERGVSMFPPKLGEYDKFAIAWLYGNDSKKVLKRAKGNEMLAYEGNSVSAKPDNPAAQSVMLGNDILKSTKLGLANIDNITAHLDEWLPAEMNRWDVMSELSAMRNKLLYLVQANIGGHYKDASGRVHQVSEKQQKATQEFLNEQEKLKESTRRHSVVALANADLPFKANATATFIDNRGLVLSAYHPIIKYLGMLSNEQHDFLKNGYFGNAEYPLYGLAVTQLIASFDVSKEMKDSIKTKEIIEKYKPEDKLESRITLLNDGKTYILNFYKVYRDVRLVAAPPQSLGKFNGENDNWRWPRTTIDAALLRVYTDSIGRPSEYNAKNISLKGNEFLTLANRMPMKGDTLSVTGYPARTKWYVPSFAIKYMIEREIPSQIELDSLKIDIISRGIEKHPEARFTYNSILSGLWNNMLKQKGLLKGLQSSAVISQREAQEAELNSRIMAQQKAVYDSLIPYKIGEQYFQQACLNGPEVIPFAGKFEKLVQMFARKRINIKAINREARHLKDLADQFYRNWNYDINREMYAAMLTTYMTNVNRKFLSPEMIQAVKECNGDMTSYADSVFKISIITQPQRLYAFIDGMSNLKDATKSPLSDLTSDPIYKLGISFYKTYIQKINSRIRPLYANQSKLYTQYLEELDKKSIEKSGKSLTPDANGMQTTSYGNLIAKTTERDFSAKLNTMSDEMKKEVEETMPQSLKNVQRKKTQTSNLKPQTFNLLSSCFTCGGCSGAPVINGNNEIVGVNFDRTAESIASEYIPNSKESRNISVAIPIIKKLFEKQFSGK